VIYNAHDTQYIFERHDQKLNVLAFQGHFHELLPIVLGFRGELQAIWQSVHFREEWQKNLLFLCLWPFSCPQFWGAGVIYKAHATQYMFERRDQKLIVFVF
jgi:hypothetical protein